LLSGVCETQVLGAKAHAHILTTLLKQYSRNVKI
jgi:hypothetical protein